MKSTLAHISGEYLLIAAIDTALPLWLRRTCEYTARLFDFLARGPCCRDDDGQPSAAKLGGGMHAAF